MKRWGKNLPALGLLVAALGALAITTGEPFLLERSLGWLALLLLLLSLAATPTMRLVTDPELAAFILASRRPLGLLGAGAGLLHAVVSWIGYFGPDALLRNVDVALGIPWLSQGLLALSVLGILSLTSMRALARRLRAWRSVHRLAYAAALLSISHALFGPHSGQAPLWALAIVLVLFSVRLYRRGRRRASDAEVAAPSVESPDTIGHG